MYICNTFLLQAKLERRSELIASQLEKLLQKKENESPEVNVGSKATDIPTNSGKLGEQYPDFVRKDGKLNSRQLLEMLQRQDRRQEKVGQNYV